MALRPTGTPSGWPTRPATRGTEVNTTTGALIRVIAGQGYQLADPGVIAADGGHVWVADAGADAVTEIDAATGAVVRVISAPRYRLDTTVYPPSIAVAGDRVWVTDGNSDALTEIDATTARWSGSSPTGGIS